MPTTTRSRESIEDKAERLIADGRVETFYDDAPRAWVGVVKGDHGRYAICAFSEDYMAEIGKTGEPRMGCELCDAAKRRRLCSHAVVAEKMRTREVA